jgi:UDP-glucose 4-epimerase
VLKNKRILILGGTGSLGGKLLDRILNKTDDLPSSITIFSRDEDKQFHLKNTLSRKYEHHNIVKFILGDIRNFSSIRSALKNQDIVLGAAALKHVPGCELHPFEAVQTNILGYQNVINAIEQGSLPVETVIGISTDKACKPVNAMGMSKALQEKLYIAASTNSSTRYVLVRYGNVLGSRGSLIPIFKNLLANKIPLTITDFRMTRFLMTLDQSVDIVFDAIKYGKPGEIFIPRVPSAIVMEIAEIMAPDQEFFEATGIRPGEKLHEILVSEEEAHRTYDNGKNYVIQPAIPSFIPNPNFNYLIHEYGSKDEIISKDEVRKILKDNGFLN